MNQERYDLQDILSDEGGMGITYKGFDKNLHREIVVKAIKPSHLSGNEQQISTFRQLFRDEALFQASLNHPNIAQVYDYFEIEENGHIVFEYVKGLPLHRLSDLINPGKERLIETLSIIEQILKAIHFAHSKGIIHRDIKPNNMMYDSEEQLVKIIDFGIAKIKEAAPRPYTAQEMYTDFFVAPERIIKDIPIDTEEKFDIFSLGVTLFLLLTGDVPYKSRVDFSNPPPRISDYRDDVNQDIEEHINSMVQVLPTNRLSSLSSLIQSVKKQLRSGYQVPISIPRSSDNKIRDSIHGYISFTNEEMNIINHPIFQRLRRIKQLSTTYLVYPGATHDRFSHSLGVVHVATKMFDEIVSKNSNKLSWDDTEARKQRQMLRLCALLHDIGHAPFSHVGDGLFPQTIQNHEKMASHLIKNTDLSNLIDTIGSKYGFNHKEISGLIEGRYISKYSLIKQIFSSQLDADKMDYLLRDSRMSGVTYGNYDIGHLIRSLTVHFDNNEPVLAVEEAGIHALEGLILARYFMFIQVYFHKTRRIYDKILEKIMYDMLPSNTLPSNVSVYINLDDFRVLEMIKNIQSTWNEMFFKRNHLKMIFQIFAHADKDTKLKASDLKQKLIEKGFERSKLIIDEYQQSPVKFNDEEGNPTIRVIDKSHNFHSVDKYSLILSRLNEPIYIFRIYAHPVVMDEVSSIIKEVF